MWTHSWSTVCNPQVTRTPKRQRLNGFLSFIVLRIRGTTWLFVSYLCGEGDKTSWVSSHSYHSKTEQQNIWHLTLSFQCWIFVKRKCHTPFGLTAFFWISENKQDALCTTLVLIHFCLFFLSNDFSSVLIVMQVVAVRLCFVDDAICCVYVETKSRLALNLTKQWCSNFSPPWFS